MKGLMLILKYLRNLFILGFLGYIAVFYIVPNYFVVPEENDIIESDNELMKYYKLYVNGRGENKEEIVWNGSNMEEFNMYFNEYLNEERVSLGLNPVEYAPYLQNGINALNKELIDMNTFNFKLDLDHDGIAEAAHVRANGDPFYMIYGIAYDDNYNLCSNELLVTIKPLDAMDMQMLAKYCFDLWKGSPDHYANFIRPEVKTSAVGFMYNNQGYIIANQVLDVQAVPIDYKQADF